MKHVIDILLSHKASGCNGSEATATTWHVQAQTIAQRFATVSGLNDVFPRNSVQRGFRYVFLFGGCVYTYVYMHWYIASQCGVETAPVRTAKLWRELYA